jgi:hypothetical protein
MDLPARYTPTGDEFTGGGMSDAIVCNDEHLERLVLVNCKAVSINRVYWMKLLR